MKVKKIKKYEIDVTSMIPSNIINLSKIAELPNFIANKIFEGKYHGKENKPYICSQVYGGIRCDDKICFSKKHASMTFRTNDSNIIKTLYNFDCIIKEDIIYPYENLLTVKRFKHNDNFYYEEKNGVKVFIGINHSNEIQLIKFFEKKYGIEIIDFKYKPQTISYKGQNDKANKIYVPNLVLKIKGDNGVDNLFLNGIGNSTGIGFGFVSQINNI